MKRPNIDRRLGTILLIVFVQLVGASMVLPILPLYAQRQFDMTPQLITLLVSSFFMMQFLAGPVIGRLSDRYGRLPVLIISQIGTVVSFVILAFATNVEMLFLSRILDGVTGGNIVVAQAYVTDISPRERRTQNLGLIFAAFGLGFVFGPALGGIFSAAFGERIPFLIAAIAAAGTVVLTWRVLDESLSPEQRENNRRKGRTGLNPRIVLANGPLMTILMLAFGGQFTLGLLQATFALYGEAVLFAGYSEQITNLGIGLLLACVGLAQLFTQLVLLQRMINRFGEARLVFIGTLVRGLGMFALAMITTPWLGPFAIVLFATGSGIMLPPLQSLTTNTVGDEYRGGVLGLYQSAQSLSIIFGTALAGILFNINPTVPYWLAGGLSIFMAVPAILIIRWEATELATDETLPEAENATTPVPIPPQQS